MFQKFNTDTLMSRFVKNLLAKESIPLLNTVLDGEIIIAGCKYIYKNYVIFCVTTGKLYISETEVLYPSDTLYPSEVLFPETGYKSATFRVISYYDESTAVKFSYHYKSSEHFYDSDTHRHLGEYLRFLRGNKQLDLMPFYNCYNALEIGDVYLTAATTGVLHPADDLYPDESLYPGMIRTQSNNKNATTYMLGSSSAYRVIAVPIKFGKEYTIYLDSATTVVLRGIIYSPTAGMIKKPSTENSYYSDETDLSASYKLLATSRFDKPFLYSIETRDSSLYNLERSLYLVIQLAASNNSSIVVLEGNYLNNGAVKTSDAVVDNDTGKITGGYVRKYSLYKNLSLTRVNTNMNYAFSDRLIEYLLDNVITHQDEFPANIAEVQKALFYADSTYRSLINKGKIRYGIWDDNIQPAVLRMLDDHRNEFFFEDQDGFINKDIEKALLQIGGRYR